MLFMGKICNSNNVEDICNFLSICLFIHLFVYLFIYSVICFIQRHILNMESSFLSNMNPLQCSFCGMVLSNVRNKDAHVGSKHLGNT